MPVGETLKTDIARLLDFYFDGGQQTKGDHEIAEALRQTALELYQDYYRIQSFVQKGRMTSDAMPTALSIDNFIDAHRGDAEVELCAKLAIAKAIIEAERHSKLAEIDQAHKKFMFSTLANTWIVRVFQMLTENVSLQDIESVFENISFIVFNYDRCLEAFLPRALSIYYGITFQQAETLCDKLRIVHPYGSVGSLRSGVHPHIPYGAERYNLRIAASGIRTFTEGVGDRTIVDNIGSMVQEAETMVFLGFAFHPINMELLKQKAPSLRRVFATTLGISDSARDVIKDDIMRIFEKEDPLTIRFEDGVVNSLDELDLPSFAATDFCSQYFRTLAGRVEWE